MAPFGDGGPISLFVFALLATNSYTDDKQSSQKCQNERVILTNHTGFVSHGLEEYNAFSRCEWLIDAGGSGKFIYLEFEFLVTECSYDYLFIFDGTSYNSTQLTSLSGNTVPEPVLARSGYMLLFMFSDRNYQLAGFRAKYTIQDCPFDCSKHGVCVNQVCDCDSDYIGDACEYEVCPSSCSGHGQCVKAGDKRDWGCKCRPGYAGTGCQMPLSGEAGKENMVTLIPSVANFTGRLGHTSVYDEKSGCIYVFGGYTLNNILDDLEEFCLESSFWNKIEKKEPWPEARYDHSVVMYDVGFYVFGGVSFDGSHSNKLWFYNFTSRNWSLHATNSTIQPASLSGHSMTLVEDSMYVIGGKTSDGLYSPFIYSISASAPDSWSEVKVTGGRTFKRLLHAHSAVYHKESQTILIYGGISVKSAQYAELSRKIFAFSIVNHFWSDIQYRDQGSNSNVPEARSHHVALIMGNYMVVYGGKVHIHQREEKCYDEKIYLYHLGCHQWVNHSIVHQANTGNFPKKGRFGHSAVSVNGNILIIIGGYSGYTKGEVLAYKFPGVVAPPQSEMEEDKDYCMNYTHSSHQCYKDLECIWCWNRKDINRGGCVHRTRTEMCSDAKEAMVTACQGICSLLMTCQSCLSQGQGVQLTSMSPRRRFYQEECSWCVKNSTCQRKAGPEGTCQSADGTTSGIQGWWDGLSPSWTTIEQCSDAEIPGGVQWMTYYYPANLSQPDDVKILAKISSVIQTHTISLVETRGYILSRCHGYIWPLNAPPASGMKDLKPYLSAQNMEVLLMLSNDSSIVNLERVAYIKESNKQNVINAHRGSRQKEEGNIIFPNVSRGYKYYFYMNATKDLKAENSEDNGSIMIQWNADVENFPETPLHLITLEFLEQFHSDQCPAYTNCLACMTDASCGWCPATNTCIFKGDNSTTECVGPDPVTYLITSPTDCIHCPDYVDCKSCSEDHLCQWVLDKEQCFRRGRFQVQGKEQCNVPCHERHTCSSCISEKNSCFWCETTQTCLPFAHYSAQFIHGQCRDWMDSEGKKTYGCRNCSSLLECDKCLSSYGCGWCGDFDNPLIGKCVRGSFEGPSNEECPAVVADIAKLTNATYSGYTNWTYDKCLDVNECRLGLHDCHFNATCINNATSYECRCNRGFTGSGKNCSRTCFFDCVHGKCSDDPDYQCMCDLGWTGPDCNTNCECNNQSTCKNGVGFCDECQNNTDGSNCEKCLFGYYGDPTVGCRKCQCHLHGNKSMGYCDNTTGECFCTGNTEGFICQRCAPMHYGSSVDGGKCYRQCDSRVMLNQSEGSLGLKLNWPISDWHVYCLWIITVPEKDVTLYDPPTVSVHVDGIDTQCGKDFVRVYDGIPGFITGSAATEDSGKMMAAFCGDSGYSVVARTTTVTVYFEADLSFYKGVLDLPSFNISYHANQCQTCAENQTCVGDVCVCEPGFHRDNCSQKVCHDGCEYNEVLKSCKCATNYGGSSFYSDVFPWHFPEVSEQSFTESRLGRYGHSIVACEDSSFYMFGGFSLKDGPLNDIWMFNVTLDKWTHVPPLTTDEPTGRYYHAAVCVPLLKVIYVYGGIIRDPRGESNYTVTKEVWKFSIGPRMWKQLVVPDTLRESAGHTMTLIGDSNLLIIGGFSSQNYFSDKVYEYDTKKDELKGWSEYSRGYMKGAVPIGLYGHSAVYQRDTETIYIFGGMVYKMDKFEVSSDLYAFDVQQKRWNLLQASAISQKDPRIFHTAVDMGEYMVVVGGRTMEDNPSHGILVYRYMCNFWHKFLPEDTVYTKALSGLLSPSATVANDIIYLVGGFDGVSHGEVVRLDLPEDICSLISDRTCVLATGCSACVVMDTDSHTNQTICFTNNKPEPLSCTGVNVVDLTGVMCSLQWHQERLCTTYKNCHSCLASYPYFQPAEQTCQWCSNCGKCISKREDCQSLQNCIGTSVSMEADFNAMENYCLESCMASDCDRCHSSGNCVWTNCFNISDETNNKVIDTNPIYNWNCFHETSFAERHFSLETCPKKCNEYKNCDDCLTSSGGEGGTNECYWSSQFKECMPPAFLPLHCFAGECGMVLRKKKVDNVEKCPARCIDFYVCSDCIKAPGCGWCAYAGRNGEGVCMDGGIDGPIGDGFCEQGKIVPNGGIMGYHFYQSLVDRSDFPPTWAYTQCPPENECDNTHHNCNNESQDCIDLLFGYNCTCKQGYIQKDGEEKCTPHCHKKCEHGKCVRPDNCQCDFGWVGPQCSVQCQCHGNSECLSEDQLDICIRCVNNTQGNQCQECKPNYVGEPSRNKACISCREHCYHHTNVCTSVVDYSNSSINFHPEREKGPEPDKAVCRNCQNNTEGQQCEKCKDGYFRVIKDGKTLTDTCIKCQCQGHSDTCNANTGENCQCMNNTETRCGNQNADKDSQLKCWQRQCSACKEYFFGNPIDGHHCYRQMTVDKEYCFDPDTQIECNQNPGPLRKGRTVFFAVQPRYLNVDIRITIDVSDGAVDVYFSSNENTFIVRLNEYTGIHNVELDNKLLNPRWTNPNLIGRRKRSVLNVTSGESHDLLEMMATNFHTYHTVERTKTIIKFSNLQSRLVVTLPLELHDLRTSKFYIILRGIGNKKTTEAYGDLYFRQDQPHIDLFVFFSVFFSSFFLFLAKCVLLWKLKQAVDAQRSRQRQQKEMMHMASRPFAKVLVLIEPEPVIYSSTPVPRRRKLPKLPMRNMQTMGTLTPVETTLPPILQNPIYNLKDSHSPFDIVPIATEPTGDNLASLRTVALQLPGGNSAPVKLGLATALTMLNTKNSSVGPKSNIRHRSSYTNC